MRHPHVLTHSRTRLAVVAASMALLALASTGPRAHAGFYVSDNGNGLNTGGVDIVPPGGGTATQFVNMPVAATGMTADSQGNLYVASFNTKSILEVTPGGVVTTYATLPSPVGGPGAIGLVFDSTGNLYISDQSNSSVDKVGPGGGMATIFANLAPLAGFGNYALDLTIDKSGNIFAALNNGTVARITSGGAVSAFVSGLGSLNGITIDKSGNIYVSDVSNNLVDKITTAGVVTPFITNILDPHGLAFDSAGNLFVSSFARTSGVYEFGPNGGSSGVLYATGIANPVDIVITPSSVPEPSSLALMGISGALVIPYLRRRRRRVA